jgi:hypothetical protein
MASLKNLAGKTQMVENQVAKNRFEKIKARCPECDAVLSRDALRIQDGVAHCDDCGTETQLSELNMSRSSREEIIDQPPEGCRIQFERHGVRLTASYYSLSGFLYLLKASVMWNVILICILIPLSTGLKPLSYLWSTPREMGPSGGLGEILIPRLILFPLVAIGVLLIASALVNWMGRIEVFIGENESYVARCLGSIQWKMPFDPSQVESVKICDAKTRINGVAKRLIEIRGEAWLRFGAMLQDERLVWLHAASKTQLQPFAIE